jgi:uncharacterized protein YegP (UPF0339 family)
VAPVAHVKLKRDHAGEWRFAAVAANGEVVATSEGYARKIDAEREAGKLYPGVAIVEE